MLKQSMVLILCTGNSCRSQMAEGFLRKYAADRFTVASAGTIPQPHVHPLAVRVMAEVGIDITRQRPKSLTEFLGKAPVRHLMIVCDNANGTCPRIWPGCYSRQYLPFDDPAAFEGTSDQMLEEFRRVRDQIDEAMRTWKPEKDQAATGLRP